MRVSPRRHLWLLVLLLLSSTTFAQVKVVYPNINLVGESGFPYAALKLALEKSGVDYDLKLLPFRIDADRVRTLIDDKTISIADFGTSKQFESQYKAIYFPIDLGLNGWRVLLVRKSKENVFGRVRSIKALTRLSAGQGKGWSDVNILRGAGIRVMTAPHLDQLFRMLETSRFDFIPLGANEAHALLDAHRQHAPDVVVDKKLLLVYPFARFFFVSKNNQTLHDIVYSGLVTAFNDGSFQRLFHEHPDNQAFFKKVNAEERLRIDLANPGLSPAFHRIPKSYFFNFEQFPKNFEQFSKN